MRRNSRAAVAANVPLNLCNRVGVVFFDGHGQQLPGIVEPGREFVENDDDLLELCTLLAQSLGALRFIPYVRLFELALDLGQAFSPALIVKDTSSTHQCVR